MKLAAMVIVIGYCLCMPDAWAQCAAGVDTGGGNCIPPDALGMPGYQDGANSRRAPQPRAIWADRWGAIATDAESGSMGTAEGKASESEAKKIAAAFCESDGSKRCGIRLTFHNQCAAMAWGDGKAGYSASPTSEQAERLAVKECGHGDACKIIYSQCSYPQRVQ